MGMLLDAFKAFDKDGSGRLEHAEVAECLQHLTLGSTKLTPREIRMVMMHLDEDESGSVEYNEFAPLMYNYLVEALKMGFLQSETDDVGEYLLSHLSPFASPNGALTRAALKNGLSGADLLMLTPVQVMTLVADAPFDDNGTVDLATFCGPASRMITKMVDPQLEHKRMMVSKMAAVTPLQALSPEEKQRLARLAESVFLEYDQDKSGKLDRVEFSRCLTESQLGFTERQIQAMMLAVDEDENDLIDYSEFANLFENVILEISRQDKIDKMLAGEEAADRLAADLELFLDELMIPLHIAYDIACDGGESCASGAITQLLLVKCPEWGIGEEAMNALCEAVLAYGEALEWAHVVEVIEKLAIPS